jgi:hypothetical protein
MLDVMAERATLRPVPQRPSGPVDPAAALAHVERHLPGADDAARRALALVEIAGHTRAQTAAETGLGAEEVADALARARKALRRAAFPLPGSGWCERAERLLSDELDGELADPGPRRLAAHLANCDRCSEHERRLWQARDRLIATFEEARAPSPVAALPAETPDAEPVELPEPELKLVEPSVVQPSVVETPAPVPPEPVPAPIPEEPMPAATRPAAGLAWSALWAITLLLTIASIALTVYAIAGGGF